MDKSCQSSEDSGTNSGGGAAASSAGTSGGGGRDQYLKHLNKFSHKISKPTIKKPSFDDPVDQNHNFRPPATAAPPQNMPNQHQPPVYNINKSDFRDVVQKLTGSPAHERLSAAPPPIHAPKPQSTRLQRIRPPPLAHVSNRPPPMLAGAAPNFNSFSRPAAAPLSPLPPLPSVHAAAVSPVSAYMRFLHNTASNLDQNLKQFPGFSFSPLAPAPATAPPPQQQGMGPPPAAAQPQFQLPSSPLPFGCSNSPKSQYPLLSPSSSSFPQFPLSPRVPLSSPRWRDL